MKNRGKPLSDDQLAKAMRETLAEVVLKGWRGLKDGGKDMAYSADQATKFITSRNGERFASIDAYLSHQGGESKTFSREMLRG